MSIAEAQPSMAPESDQPDNRRGGGRNYQILTHDPLFSNKRSTEAMQEDYLTRTSRMIETIAGGGSGEPYDVVIFLDKSAPLYWMMRDMWPHVAPERKDSQTGQTKTVEMPDVKFLNVDRIPWRNDPGIPLEEAGMKPILPEHVEGLRNIYKNNNGTDFLDGKRILVVDEQAETGDTLTVAVTLLRKAFPDSEFDRFAWMQHPKSGVVDKPAWYPVNSKLANGEEDQSGRGVFNPVIYNPRLPAHGQRFIPESYQFLSTTPIKQIPLEKLNTEDTRRYTELVSESERLMGTDPDKAEMIYRRAKNLLHERDQKSKRLRREIGQMVLDFVSGRLHPRIKTSKRKILGKPNKTYNRQATQIRYQRNF